jgi:SPP1 family predicted phage head-tail adaptor
MMLTQRLRHRVDIEALTVELDSNGVTTEEWQTIRDSSEPDLIPAGIEPLSGREFIAAQAVQAGVTTRITLRWREGLKPSMRIVHGDDLYNILAILPDPTLRRHVNLMCSTGVNQG